MQPYTHTPHSHNRNKFFFSCFSVGVVMVTRNR